ncbi:MAG: hypothetical protein AVDCRST_MAG68-3949, partial [uncultured Gemmatimonadetes bacterium]
EAARDHPLRAVVPGAPPRPLALPGHPGGARLPAGAPGDRRRGGRRRAGERAVHARVDDARGGDRRAAAGRGGRGGGGGARRDDAHDPPGLHRARGQGGIPGRPPRRGAAPGRGAVAGGAGRHPAGRRHLGCRGRRAGPPAPRVLRVRLARHGAPQRGRRDVPGVRPGHLCASPHGRLGGGRAALHRLPAVPHLPGGVARPVDARLAGRSAGPHHASGDGPGVDPQREAHPRPLAHGELPAQPRALARRRRGGARADAPPLPAGAPPARAGARARHGAPG